MRLLHRRKLGSGQRPRAAELVRREPKQVAHGRPEPAGRAPRLRVRDLGGGPLTRRSLLDVPAGRVRRFLEARLLEPERVEQQLLHRVREGRARRRRTRLAGEHVAGVRVRPEPAARLGEQRPRARPQIGRVREEPPRARAALERRVEVEEERRERGREPLRDRRDPKRRLDLDGAVCGELHPLADEEPCCDSRNAGTRACLTHYLGQPLLRNRARHAAFRYPTPRPRPGSRHDSCHKVLRTLWKDAAPWAEPRGGERKERAWP